MKELQLIELRRSGLDWDSIAVQVGYKSADVARQLWKRTLERRTVEGIEQIRSERVETLTGVLQTFYPKMRRGDEKAAEVVIKTVKQLDRYFPGIYGDADPDHEQTQLSAAEEIVAMLTLAREQYDAQLQSQATDIIDVEPIEIEAGDYEYAEEVEQ